MNANRRTQCEDAGGRDRRQRRRRDGRRDHGDQPGTRHASRLSTSSVHDASGATTTQKTAPAVPETTIAVPADQGPTVRPAPARKRPDVSPPIASVTQNSGGVDRRPSRTVPSTEDRMEWSEVKSSQLKLVGGVVLAPAPSLRHGRAFTVVFSAAAGNRQARVRKSRSAKPPRRRSAPAELATSIASTAGDGRSVPDGFETAEA